MGTSSRESTVWSLVAIDSIALLVLGIALQIHESWVVPPVGLGLFWILLSFSLALSQTRLPVGGALTDVGDLIDIAGIAIVGPYPVILGNLVVLLFLTFRRRETDRWMRLGVNAAARLVSVTLAALVFGALRPSDASQLSVQLVLAVAASTATYGATLTSHVSAAVALTGRLRFWQVFRRNYLLPELASILLVPIPIAAILLWAETGIWGVLLLTLPLLAASYGIRAVFERGQLAERMERERHLTQLGTSAASILHEVQKPISRIVAEADLAATEIPESADRFARLRDWAREAGEVANELLMALSGRVATERFVLGKFVKSLIGDLPSSQKERISTRIEVPPEQMVTWDMRGIRLVLENIILNAFEADSGTITFSVTIPEGASASGRWRKKVPKADRVTVQISDAGTGLPPTDNEKIFEPLFTTKPSGTGLGLFLSNQMIKAHGGELSATRNLDGGTTFTVLLPIEVATDSSSV